MTNRNHRNDNRLAFLIGAGMSQAAGLPGTQEITNKILSGDGIMHHTNGAFYFGKPLYAHIGLPDEYVPRMAEFAKILKDKIMEARKGLNRDGREPNYEDLRYHAIEINNYFQPDTYNAGLRPFVQMLENETIPQLQRRHGGIIRDLTVSGLTAQVSDYIYDVAWHMVEDPNRSVGYLPTGPPPATYNRRRKIGAHQIIVDAYDATAGKGINIFCLNHDTLIEKAMGDSRIKYVDGFGPIMNGKRLWNPAVFSRRNTRVRLFKLHGSVDWYYMGERGWGKGSYPICKTTSIDVLDNLKRPRPLLLVGTMNKIIQYADWIYGALSCMFRNALATTQHIIIIGYSFGDSGINDQLIDWLITVPEGSVIVVNPDKNLRDSLPVNMSALFHKRQDKVHYRSIPKHIEDTSWAEIAALL